MSTTPHETDSQGSVPENIDSVDWGEVQPLSRWGGNETEEDTIETLYACPIDDDCDGHPPNALFEHLLTEHTLEERTSALLANAEATYEY